MWACTRCNSTDVQVSVEWCDSLEEVDQEAMTLEPAECNPERAHIGQGFCNSCGANGDAHEVIVPAARGGIRPPG